MVPTAQDHWEALARSPAFQEGCQEVRRQRLRLLDSALSSPALLERAEGLAIALEAFERAEQAAMARASATSTKADNQHQNDWPAGD